MRRNKLSETLWSQRSNKKTCNNSRNYSDKNKNGNVKRDNSNHNNDGRKGGLRAALKSNGLALDGVMPALSPGNPMPFPGGVRASPMRTRKV